MSQRYKGVKEEKMQKIRRVKVITAAVAGLVIAPQLQATVVSGGRTYVGGKFSACFTKLKLTVDKEKLAETAENCVKDLRARLMSMKEKSEQAEPKFKQYWDALKQALPVIFKHVAKDQADTNKTDVGGLVTVRSLEDLALESGPIPLFLKAVQKAAPIITTKNYKTEIGAASYDPDAISAGIIQEVEAGGFQKQQDLAQAVLDITETAGLAILAGKLAFRSGGTAVVPTSAFKAKFDMLTDDVRNGITDVAQQVQTTNAEMKALLAASQEGVGENNTAVGAIFYGDPAGKTDPRDPKAVIDQLTAAAEKVSQTECEELNLDDECKVRKHANVFAAGFIIGGEYRFGSRLFVFGETGVDAYFGKGAEVRDQHAGEDAAPIAFKPRLSIPVVLGVGADLGQGVRLSIYGGVNWTFAKVDTTAAKTVLQDVHALKSVVEKVNEKIYGTPETQANALDTKVFGDKELDAVYKSHSKCKAVPTIGANLDIPFNPQTVVRVGFEYDLPKTFATTEDVGMEFKVNGCKVKVALLVFLN